MVSVVGRSLDSNYCLAAEATWANRLSNAGGISRRARVSSLLSTMRAGRQSSKCVRPPLDQLDMNAHARHRAAAIIDPVLDFDLQACKASTTCADAILAYCAEHELDVQYILETHAHADHLSASQYLKAKLGGKVCHFDFPMCMPAL